MDSLSSTEDLAVLLAVRPGTLRLPRPDSGLQVSTQRKLNADTSGSHRSLAFFEEDSRVKGNQAPFLQIREEGRGKIQGHFLGRRILRCEAPRKLLEETAGLR